MPLLSALFKEAKSIVSRFFFFLRVHVMKSWEEGASLEVRLRREIENKNGMVNTRLWSFSYNLKEMIGRKEDCVWTSIIGNVFRWDVIQILDGAQRGRHKSALRGDKSIKKKEKKGTLYPTFLRLLCKLKCSKKGVLHSAQHSIRFPRIIVSASPCLEPTTLNWVTRSDVAFVNEALSLLMCHRTSCVYTLYRDVYVLV